MNRPGQKPGRFSFLVVRHAHAAAVARSETNTIDAMPFDPTGDRAARGTALRGAAVGLALAAALLLPAALAGRMPARGDLPDFFLPMKAYTAQRWTEGSIPLWNPLSGAGEPWLAQLQSGALYPGDLPFLLGEERGALLGIALHLAIAAAGAAYWLWELGGSRSASLLAGGLYAGGGAFLSLVPVYNNACTAAFLPWLFAGARRVVVGRSRGAGFAVAVAGAFLAGEPALAAAGTVAAAALALFAGTEGELPSSLRPGSSLPRRILLPGLAGVLLAGAALAPFAGLVSGSERRQRTTREEALARPVGPSDLADLFAAPAPAATRIESPGRGGYLITLAAGPLALALASLAGAGLPGRPRLLAGLGLVAFGALVIAVGARGLLAPLLFDAGLLRGLRFPARWFVFTHLALALAAGAGLDGALWGRVPARRVEAEQDDRPPEETARSRTALPVLGIVLLAAALLAAGCFLLPEARASRDRPRAITGLAALLAAGAVVAVARRRPEPFRKGPAALVALLGVAPLPWLAGEPLAAVRTGAVRAEPAALAGIPRGPASGRVFAPAGQDRSLAMRWRHERDAAWSEETVARAGRSLAGYSNLRFGLATVGSGSPLGNPRTEGIAGAALEGGSASRLLALLDVRHVLSPFLPRIAGLRAGREAGGLRAYALDGAYGRAYFPLGARVATDGEAREELRRAGFDPESAALVAPLAPGVDLPEPRSPGAFAAARFLADGPERAEIATSASRAALLVLTRSWDPGWEATIDGARVPLLRAQLGLQAVVVPAGDHRIELRYRPASFRIGLALSAAGLLAVLALALSSPPGGRSR